MARWWASARATRATIGLAYDAAGGLGSGEAIPIARLRYLSARVHSLGPRPLFELLSELAAGAPLGERLEAYAALAPLADFIRDHGGDRLPIARPVGADR